MTTNATHLTDSESPSEPDPIPFRAWAGDHDDDDGQAIDDVLESAWQGPPVESEEPPAGKPEIKTTTRLIVRGITIPFGHSSLILPPDINREQLVITVPALAVSYIAIAADSTELAMAGPLNNVLIQIDEHTGAVWATNRSADTNFAVSVMAVTR